MCFPGSASARARAAGPGPRILPGGLWDPCAGREAPGSRGRPRGRRSRAPRPAGRSPGRGSAPRLARPRLGQTFEPLPGSGPLGTRGNGQAGTAGPLSGRPLSQARTVPPRTQFPPCAADFLIRAAAAAGGEGCGDRAGREPGTPPASGSLALDCAARRRKAREAGRRPGVRRAPDCAAPPGRRAQGAGRRAEGAGPASRTRPARAVASFLFGPDPGRPSPSPRSFLCAGVLTPPCPGATPAPPPSSGGAPVGESVGGGSWEVPGLGRFSVHCTLL